MSFVRVGRPQPHSKAKRPVRPKTAAVTKREWVSTVSDLSVHKPTPAELRHRHEIHKSHNKAAAQWELREKALKRRFRHGGSPAPLDQASLSIIREVFSDQLLLQDVLARSDRAMAVVKDLFGDAPRRQTGHPSVTMAPNCDSDSELPLLQKPDPPTQLSLLSQSMMDQQALNEIEASEECSDKDPYSCGNSRHSVIRRANVRKMKTQSLDRVVQQPNQHPNFYQTYGENVPDTPCTSGRGPDQTALNATVAIKRVRSRQKQLDETNEEASVLVSQVLNPDVPFNHSEKLSSHPNRSRKCVSQSSELDGSSFASLNGDKSSLGMLQAMLTQVEAELNSMSPDTTPGAAQKPEQHRIQGLTGFSVALVSALGRLVHLIKQKEEEAHREAQERRRLEDELKEQRGLIDALTAETMTLREEAVTLQAVLQRQTAELQQKFDTVVLLMGDLGLQDDAPQDSDIGAADYQSASVPEQLPQRPQVAKSAAFLLSPPRQTNNFQHIPMAHPVLMQQHLSPVDNLSEDVSVRRSASSLTSLPLASLLTSSSESLGSQIASEAMLAEITKLSRQNDMLRAQLRQDKGLGSGVGLSPNGSTEERRPSPCSSGRITPLAVEDKRTSGSKSTDRLSHNIQNADNDRPAQQATSPNTLSVSSVEQRILELNRQSAAARGRLLELIEQQKQSVSSKVSPSVSPTPQPTFSPHAGGGGGSPGVPFVSPSGGCNEQSVSTRSAGPEVSSLSSRGETRDGKTQMKRLRVQEGWFALSNHVR
ncbi:spindle and centriole-associated protein 1 [Betta splendens]|uniref:Spindle and centriole-associated protein 1 n=1 Tax=Betta splendens TaxID=158456 RepID=A0A6P7M580_BETSP|nr:spindle and centriole-associated protein 1 [Betta splendens]XP_055364505.1 spindle and centriole-associated protein 1 [Betta splendens]